MKEELMKQITNNTTQINLEGKNIKDDEIDGLMKLLKELAPTLEQIDLDNNDINDAGAIILATHLHDFPNLKTLCIQNNKIAHAGATALFSLKQDHPSLEILFRNNTLKDAAALYEIEHANRRSFRP